LKGQQERSFLKKHPLPLKKKKKKRLSLVKLLSWLNCLWERSWNTMASQEHLDKMQLRQNYRNLWHTDLMGTVQADAPCKKLVFLQSYFVKSCDLCVKFLGVWCWFFVFFLMLRLLLGSLVVSAPWSNYLFALKCRSACFFIYTPLSFVGFLWFLDLV